MGTAIVTSGKFWRQVERAFPETSDTLVVCALGRSAGKVTPPTGANIISSPKVPQVRMPFTHTRRHRRHRRRRYTHAVTTNANHHHHVHMLVRTQRHPEARTREGSFYPPHPSFSSCHPPLQPVPWQANRRGNFMLERGIKPWRAHVLAPLGPNLRRNCCWAQAR